jgi:para-aminobenzoate synthetase / 4-amino-4-deoxychorismate lyase
MLVRGGRVQALDRHLQRFAAAAADLYGEEPAAAELTQRITAVAASTSGDRRMRVRAAPGIGGGTVVGLELDPLALPDPSVPPALQPLLLPGGLGAYKWCDRRFLERSGADRSVPLIVDRDEEVLEAAWANVWILEGRTIVTPPADGRLLPGVTRALLLERAPKLALKTAVEPVSLVRASRADAIFLTSSLRHAVRATLDGRRAAGDGDSVVATIREALSQS